MLRETKVLTAFVLAQVKTHYKVLTAPIANVCICLYSHSLAEFGTEQAINKHLLNK